jgi:hypothetical protein
MALAPERTYDSDYEYDSSEADDDDDLDWYCEKCEENGGYMKRDRCTHSAKYEGSYEILPDGTVRRLVHAKKFSFFDTVEYFRLAPPQEVIEFIEEIKLGYTKLFPGSPVYMRYYFQKILCAMVRYPRHRVLRRSAINVPVMNCILDIGIGVDDIYVDIETMDLRDMERNFLDAIRSHIIKQLPTLDDELLFFIERLVSLGAPIWITGSIERSPIGLLSYREIICNPKLVEIIITKSPFALAYVRKHSSLLLNTAMKYGSRDSFEKLMQLGVRVPTTDGPYQSVMRFAQSHGDPFFLCCIERYSSKASDADQPLADTSSQSANVSKPCHRRRGRRIVANSPYPPPPQSLTSYPPSLLARITELRNWMSFSGEVRNTQHHTDQTEDDQD